MKLLALLAVAPLLLAASHKPEQSKIPTPPVEVVPLYPLTLNAGEGKDAVALTLYADGSCKGDLPAFTKALQELKRGGDAMLPFTVWAIVRAAQDGGGCSQ